MLPGNFNHARGNVTGDELNALSSEVNGVDAGATAQFEQLLAGGEDLSELSPNGNASGLANARTGKILHIGLSRSIPVCLCELSGIGTHICFRPEDWTQIVEALSAFTSIQENRRAFCKWYVFTLSLFGVLRFPMDGCST
jgi:hypothetical protein